MFNFDQVKKEMSAQCDKTIESLKTQFGKMRTGKANPALFDGVKVNFYGNMSPLKQVGNISTPEARVLQIQPYDKAMIPEIEKAILAANLGFTPTSDGNLVRIIFPPLTEERRKELVKDAKKVAEEIRVAVRNVRRDFNEKLKKAEKDKEVSEDQSKKYQDEIQKITDKYIKQVDELMATKEKDLMTV
jgi:ribosome recycling factor